MKGQSVIFEEVLLFGISVAIFIVAFAIFQMYQMNFSSDSLADHTRTVRDMVLGHIVELTRLGDLNASITLRIPREISGEYYDISINDTDIAVVTDRTKTTASYNIESISTAYSFSGETASRRGEIIIYKRGYNIIID